MIRQMTLDEIRAVVATDRAIDNAERGAGDEWMQCALGAIRQCASTLPEFTSDDARRYVADPPEPRAWGAAFRRASKAGIIVATDEWRIPAGRASSHRRPMRVWRAA